MTNTNPKILIVEDDPDSCDAMLRVLEAAGYKTETASDAETAFESLSKQHPDILICDIQLPGPNGIELLKSENYQRRRGDSDHRSSND